MSNLVALLAFAIAIVEDMKASHWRSESDPSLSLIREALSAPRGLGVAVIILVLLHIIVEASLVFVDEWFADKEDQDKSAARKVVNM